MPPTPIRTEAKRSLDILWRSPNLYSSLAVAGRSCVSDSSSIDGDGALTAEINDR